MSRARGLVGRVRRHRVPGWWSDAKLGLFVHWTPASVPAFAPVDADMGELMARRDPHAMAWSPYAEWYQNSMRFPESPVARHHAEVYGTKPYHEFADEWEAALDGWDPDDWARRFAATGARYVVLVTKHHDGYCLWPTDVTNPHRPGFHCRRDVVGELSEAVRAQGLRFGVYYSGGLDWTFDEHPIGTFSDLIAAQPRGSYVGYAEAQVRELIGRYRPSVLWNDISWPAPTVALAGLLADYYAAVPDGVVNDRFMPWSPAWRLAGTAPGRFALDVLAARSAAADHGIVPPKPPLFDVRTPEYTTFDTVQTTPWECVRGIDRSFGHNRASSEEHFLSRRDLLWSVIDIAAKGGNLLLNVGPRGEDATIADAQLTRLDWLAELTDQIGGGLFGTRPWTRPGESSMGADVRYLARDTTVYALARCQPDARAEPNAEPNAEPSIVLGAVRATPATSATTLDGRPLRVETTARGLRIWPAEPLGSDQPIAVALHHVDSAAQPPFRSDERAPGPPDP